MAKMFLSLSEAADMLNKSEDQVRAMASNGQLQEFRDRDRLVFKREQVELLANSQDDPVSFGDSPLGKHILAEPSILPFVYEAKFIEPVIRAISTGLTDPCQSVLRRSLIAFLAGIEESENPSPIEKREQFKALIEALTIAYQVGSGNTSAARSDAEAFRSADINAALTLIEQLKETLLKQLGR